MASENTFHPPAPASAAPVRRVLVARLDSVGDMLLSGPAIRAIAASADVAVLCSNQAEQAARALPGVAEVIAWDCPWITWPPPPFEPGAIDHLCERIDAGAFDEAIILTSFHQSPLPLALVLRLAGVPIITGASVDHAGTLLTTRLRPESDFAPKAHEVERALAIVRAAGYELPDGDDGRLRMTGWQDADMPAAFAASGLDETGPYVVLHPGAQASARTWPIERFVETAAMLRERGIQTVVTGSASETVLTRAVAQAGALNLGAKEDGEQLELLSLARVVAGASVIVVGNTGPAHVAAAVGTPVVSLFAPVVPAAWWGPYGVPHVLLGDQSAPCAGTRARECPIPGHVCLTSVTASEVVDACLNLAPLLPVAEATA